ncbi:MAG: 4-demethylwyosine synthase TYW1 [Candidatus Bilamarchaeaceae archaeon]
MVAVEQNKLIRFINASYGIVGTHSAVQICSWTKKALRGQGVCYKQKFYGIDCHRCAQMSPAFAWCHQSCSHCWRPSEWMVKNTFKEKDVDEPEKIIEETVKQRRRLICGIGGAADVSKQLFDESYNKFPSHWAISLSGEPTIYPKIGELIQRLRKQKEVRSVFLVTNGQEPQRIAHMAKRGQLPTQLYVSITAPNEVQFKKLNKSIYTDGWERLITTLNMLKKLKCRTVVRLTHIRKINDNEKAIKEFAELLEKAQPHFIEIKGYVFIGLSRMRLRKENMPLHTDVVEFSKKLLAFLPSYAHEGTDVNSRVVLLKNKKRRMDTLIVKKKKHPMCNRKQL